MTKLLMLAVAAAITENIVLCRGLEHGMHTQTQQSIPQQLRLGGMGVLFTTVAGGCGWLGRYAAETIWQLLSWTRPAMLIAVYGVAVILVMVIVNFCKTFITIKDAKIATRLVYGFVPLGTLFIVGNTSTLGWLESLVYGFGAGVGFVLVLLVSRGLHQRLEHSDLPLVFRGMPATLLTLGLLSLAVYGLLGHPLAA